MFTILRNAALSAVIGLGSIAAMPASAQASSGGVYLGFGSQGSNFGFHFSDQAQYRDRGGHRPRFDRDRGCSAREAVRKASRMGLHRARVVSENRRVIRVQGRAYGNHRATITFANARTCPVLR